MMLPLWANLAPGGFLMESKAVLIGGVLVAAGIGAGGFALSQYLRGRWGLRYVGSPSVTTNPPSPIRFGKQDMAITLSWVNPTNQTVIYGIQAATIQDGLVSGHWWTSADVAHQAVQRFAQGDYSGVAAMTLAPNYRVTQVTVGPGARGQVTFYEVVDVTPGEEWLFWLFPNPAHGALLFHDDRGNHLSSLPPHQHAVTVSVQGGVL
jgi:hypothetical protein